MLLHAVLPLAVHVSRACCHCWQKQLIGTCGYIKAQVRRGNWLCGQDMLLLCSGARCYRIFILVALLFTPQGLLPLHKHATIISALSSVTYRKGVSLTEFGLILMWFGSHSVDI